MKKPWLVALLVLSGCTKLDEKLLSDDDAARAAAIDETKRLDDSAKRPLVPKLVAKLDAAADAPRAQTIRRRALDGLVAIGPLAVPALTDVVGDGTQKPSVRGDVARWLSMLGPKAQSAMPAIERAYAETTDEDLRGNAAGALVILHTEDRKYLEAIKRCQQSCSEDGKKFASSVLSLGKGMP